MSVAVASMPGVDRRALRTGILAAAFLALGYSLIIGLSSRSFSHLLSQWRGDAVFIALVTIGFGVQMGLFSHVRRVIRGDGAATFLVAYKTPVILLSVSANGVGIALMLRTLRHAKRVASTPAVAPACH